MVQRGRLGKLDMRPGLGRDSSFNSIGVACFAFAMLLLSGVGTSFASSDGNLILDSALNSVAGGIPAGWRVHTIPDCGFRYEVHPDSNGANDFELINDAPIESIFEQSVHLRPGWYSFTAEIKIESMGSEGAAPELFVKAASFAVEDRVHPLEWTDDWRKYRTVFRAGTRVSDFEVGCAFGQWGNPNSGRFLFRNPVLLPTDDPKSLMKQQGLQVEEGYDLEGKVEDRYFRAVVQAVEPPPSHSSKESSIFNKRWTIIALNFGLLILSMVGWWAVSPRNGDDHLAQ